MKKKVEEELPPFAFTKSEIDLLSECIKRTQQYYEGMILTSSHWNQELHEKDIERYKETLKVLEDLQKRTSYIGQSEIYK